MNIRLNVSFEQSTQVYCTKFPIVPTVFEHVTLHACFSLVIQQLMIVMVDTLKQNCLTYLLFSDRQFLFYSFKYFPQKCENRIAAVQITSAVLNQHMIFLQMTTSNYLTGNEVVMVITHLSNLLACYHGEISDHVFGNGMMCVTAIICLNGSS